MRKFLGIAFMITAISNMIIFINETIYIYFYEE
jgi:hypothetical protein